MSNEKSLKYYLSRILKNRKNNSSSNTSILNELVFDTMVGTSHIVEEEGVILSLLSVSVLWPLNVIFELVPT